MSTAEDVTMQLPVDIEALLAKQRADMLSRLGAPSGDYIRIGLDKTFTFPNGDTTAEPFEAVILDFQFLNVLYEGAYARGKQNRAICYANGALEKTLAPAEDSPEPQAVSCAVCTNNQFGSAGSGKACKNKLVIAMLPADATEETPIHVLIAPPTSGKHFQRYMRLLGQQRSSIEVITRIGFDPASTYATPTFEPLIDISTGRRVIVENPNLALALQRKEEARARLEAEKPDTSAQPPASGALTRRK